jgi:hypothetical protein
MDMERDWCCLRVGLISHAKAHLICCGIIYWREDLYQKYDAPHMEITKLWWLLIYRSIWRLLSSCCRHPNHGQTNNIVSSSASPPGRGLALLYFPPVTLSSNSNQVLATMDRVPAKIQILRERMLQNMAYKGSHSCQWPRGLKTIPMSNCRQEFSYPESLPVSRYVSIAFFLM